MRFTRRSSPNRLARTLTVEQMESRQLMAVDLGITQPVIEISGESQLMIELVNRARANPSAEASRLGIDLIQNLAPGAITAVPKQPLALNQHLVDAALAHSEDMLDNNYFDHVGLDGSTPSARVRKAGYSTGAAENIAYRTVPGNDVAHTVASTHDMLFRSAGHRQNLMSDFMRDVGVGVVVGDRTFASGNSLQTAFTTENFGRENNANPAITGVAYTDTVVDDDFYSLGEGMAGILIEAVASTGQRYATRTGTHGGYVLHVPAGQYSVRAMDTAASTVATLGTLVVGTSNVKLDLLPEQFAPMSNSDSTSPETSVTTDLSNLDVNNDGLVTPMDALTVINYLNARSTNYQNKIDVNRDFLITPIDALLVINHLNTTTRHSSAAATMEADEKSPQSPRLSQLTAQATEDMRGRFDGEWELVVESAKPVTWSDTGLELNASLSKKSPTPGYQIVIRYATLIFEYRASETGALQYAGWKQVADYLADENSTCCPWAIDAPCLEALSKALHALTVDFVHSKK